MKTSRDLVIIGCLALGVVLAATSVADAALRQYFSGWTYYAARGYYYRTYYYKPAAEYAGYQHQYCIHYPSEPRYLYFFHPEERVYWGRYDTRGEPGAEFSILAPEDRREKLADIPASAFPPPGPVPPIPEAADNVPMEMPHDLPERPGS